ncbi:MAG: hypothetical protein IJX46_09850 [Clostridia bacterium]|nr:hypothetical protein [Clostridia bacterium]
MDIIEQLHECLEYAEDLDSLLQKREDCQNQLVSLDYGYQTAVRKRKTYQKAAIISLLLGIFFLAVSGGSGGLMYTVVLCVAVSAVLFVLLFKQGKLVKMMLENRNTQYKDIERKISDVSAAIDELIEEIHQHRLTEIIPPDYFAPAEINYCIEVVRKKLANTIQEALILLNAKIEQMEMQARQDEIAFRHEQQMAELIRAVEINTIATVINESNRNYKN